MVRRVVEMAKVFARDHEMMLQLTATSMALAIANAKLCAYCNTVMVDREKDKNFLFDLEQAYMDSYDIDEQMSEKFIKVSAEADKIFLELEKCRVR